MIYNKDMISLFKKDKIYKGEKVTLKERFSVSNERAFDGVGTVYYDIYNNDDYRVGSIDLRLKMDDYMYYYGHIGYDVYEPYRGNHYAYEACKVLFEIAKNKYHMGELIITCNPNNIASYKTLVKLGGECKGIVKVPINHPIYNHGDKEKYVFCYKI